MSSFSSTGNATAQRVPAWKRLGLKLKPTPEEQNQNGTLPAPTGATAPTVPNHQHQTPTSLINANAKRKSSGVPALAHSAKKVKRDISQNQDSSNQTARKVKSVSFATASIQDAGSSATASGTPVTNKKKSLLIKSPTAASSTLVKKQAPVNLEPALEYLRQWHSSRDTWKFNKNHQTKLLEQVFAYETTIPAVDIHIFYDYIRGLKGAVRMRLKELASGVKEQDMEQGPEAFAASSKEMAQRKQKEYEEAIARFLSQPTTPGKRRFNEVDYVLRAADMETQRRVVKRMRCEMVLDELSDSGDTETADTATAATTTAQGSSTVGEPEHATSEGATTEAEGVQRLSLNDGPQQRVKRKRKTRTAVVDDETSSESDSDSDSDSASDSSSDSGSSSSDSSDDEVVQPQLTVNEANSSSSSSSSSEASDSDED
ncbi:uncharacterized protein GGS25DRAFT_501595 [Hypoxylon fragiforme]|uniref:uncharacterized protein n=1 Tax=Hypoxylon fragiforme TaxID=63214 RepID=UPI0020C72BBD|nr:uncharacterized protein GGS25DRAFT_501595 [Hypoxylon fragiforme]KAI2606510.1 hypothetical protein GGS25DRAFT_501595 [Hypoxylon fragiforme]